MPSDEKKEEGRYGNIKVFSCKTRCRALSLRVEVGGFLILVWGLGVFFFFFLLPCNSGFQTEARAAWFETQLQAERESCRALFDFIWSAGR